MNAVVQAPAESRHLLSGNEAVARGIWEAGCHVAASYPGTPATEMLEYISLYPDIYAEWSVNEKVSLEVAIGASMMGSRGFCAMKHVGLNVASDALMTITLCGAKGGLVIAVADDVGMSSSQNEQDSRFWGRFAHVPVMEPCDSQEAYEYAKKAFELSEQFETPVILRLTTRICHVKSMVTVGERVPVVATGFEKDPKRWVMTPVNAKPRIPMMLEREKRLAEYSAETDLNQIEAGDNKSLGFVTSGPAYTHVRESFPDSPVLKLGFTHPLPIEKIRAFGEQVDNLVVVEEVEPIVETELRAAGIEVIGKDKLPRVGELAPHVLADSLAEFQQPKPHLEVFPRPPTMCVACPHLGVYYSLAKLKNLIIAGDIGCYTLGAGHPWNALDSTISMGASLSVALGMDKGRGPQDEDKRVLAVIGDSTFLHMGMQGLLDITYNRGNVTIMLLDNRTVGMTGAQDHAGTGRDIHGNEAPRIDMAKLCEALGVKTERLRRVDPYELPTLYKTIREEIKINDTSVILTERPCVLTDFYEPLKSLTVDDDLCNGCGNCVDVGCPAILVKRRETVTKPNGSIKELAFVEIESAVCTGCDMCVKTCGPDAIIPVQK